MVRAFTLTKIIYRLDFAPQFPLLNRDSFSCKCDVTALRYQGRDFGRGCCVVSTTETSSNINMSSSHWRDGEIRVLLTIIGEKVMHLHLTKTGEK
jgi:hypothetical protein